MRSEPVAKSACEYPGAAGAHRIKRENLSERSEFIFPPDLRLTTPGTPPSGATNQFCWSSAPTLLLLTFLGEARKVSGCRLLKQCFSPPAYQGRPKKETNKLPKREWEQNTTKLKTPQTPPAPRRIVSLHHRIANQQSIHHRPQLAAGRSPLVLCNRADLVVGAADHPAILAQSH